MTIKEQKINEYLRLADHALAQKRYATYCYWMRKVEELKE
jgi:hypothetical protein